MLLPFSLEVCGLREYGAVEKVASFEIPQDLVDGYGYLPLTETAKRKIPGENLLRLSGMDLEETRRKLIEAA